jgi:N-acetylglucosaminyl-diphospho-decaprenol L-rhamnosyltransferase
MKPRVSIVIVNWKTPELLAGCLDSLLADRGAPGFEVWVVDNASGDESLDVLRRYPAVNAVANTANVGFAKACNQVIPRAAGAYVLLLNPDTVVGEDAVSRLADYLEAHADCAAVGPKVLNPDGSLQLACRRSFPSPAAAFYRLTYLSRLFPDRRELAAYNLTYVDPERELEVDALSGSAMMVRKSVIDQVGLLDEDIFMFGEDIDWCWRFKQRGWRVTYFPRAVVHHYHGASSRLRPAGAAINLHKGMEVFYRKHLAHRYSAPFNALVYAAIWVRGGLFALLGLARSLFPRRRVVRVLKK